MFARQLVRVARPHCCRLSMPASKPGSPCCSRSQASRCELTITGKEYLPTDSIDASLFATQETHHAPPPFWPWPARQAFCSPRPARPCGLMNTSRYMASPWPARNRALSPRGANSLPTMAAMRLARLSFRRRNAVFITSCRGIRRSNMASGSAAPVSNGAAQGGLR